MFFKILIQNPNFFLVHQFSTQSSLIAFGALTSKPYAFNARKWELLSSESVDIFDVWGLSLNFEFDRLQLLRILPTFSTRFQFSWISDISRFAFLGINQFRSTVPFFTFRPLESIYSLGFPVEWQYILCQLMLLIFQKSFNLSGIFCFSSSCDLETLFSFKFLCSYFFSSTLLSTEGFLGTSTLISDFRSSFLFFKTLHFLDTSILFIFLNCNLFRENPLLSIKIRQHFLRSVRLSWTTPVHTIKGVRLQTLPSFFLSFFTYLETFTVHNLGSNFNFFSWLFGKHFCNKFLFKFSSFFILGGLSFRIRPDYFFFYSLFFFLDTTLQLNGNFIPSFLCSSLLPIHLSEIGFSSSFFLNSNYLELQSSLFFFFTSNLSNFSSTSLPYFINSLMTSSFFWQPCIDVSFSIHQFFSNGSFFQLFLPCLSYGESIMSFFSILGRKSKSIIFRISPFRLAKPEWLIFQGLFLFLNYFCAFSHYNLVTYLEQRLLFISNITMSTLLPLNFPKKIWNFNLVASLKSWTSYLLASPLFSGNISAAINPYFFTKVQW